MKNMIIPNNITAIDKDAFINCSVLFNKTEQDSIYYKDLKEQGGVSLFDKIELARYLENAKCIMIAKDLSPIKLRIFYDFSTDIEEINLYIPEYIFLLNFLKEDSIPMLIVKKMVHIIKAIFIKIVQSMKLMKTEIFL